ncbi:MAG: hypothetical protein C4321_05990, partial [Chloroflexota bacterium]
ANIIRVALIIVVGHFAGQSAAMKFHDWSSYLLFPLTIGGLLLIQKALTDKKQVSAQTSSPAVQETTPASAPGPAWAWSDPA